MEDSKNEMSITEAIERCDIMLNAISINGAEKGFANDDNGFPDCVVMKSLIRRCKWALKRQIPMKPIFNHNLSDTLSVFHCECGNTIKVSHDVGIMNNNNAPNYCSKCGCRLDWGDGNDD